MPAVQALLGDAVAADIPVLGIFLGHQILADAFGGELSLADAFGGERGPVTMTPPFGAAKDPVLAGLFAPGGSTVVAQSHNDAVTSLPEGVRLLTSSERYPFQAFRLGSALGAQFHPEASPETVGDWIARRGGDTMAARRRAAIARALTRQTSFTRSELGIGDT